MYFLPPFLSAPSLSVLITHPPQIADAYRRWGITPGKTKDLIVIKIVTPPSAAPSTTTPSPEQQQQQHQQPSQDQQSIWTHLTTHIKGTPAEFSDENLASLTDWPKVRKYYRLNGVPALAGCKDETERRRQEEKLAVMGMALKGL
jgi:EKC/KEOPS complex subunit CGI121/TPRKB